jgi:hypothetical protein
MTKRTYTTPKRPEGYHSLIGKKGAERFVENLTDEERKKIGQRLQEGRMRYLESKKNKGILTDIL